MSLAFYTHMPALNKNGIYDLTETYNGAFGDRGLSIVGYGHMIPSITGADWAVGNTKAGYLHYDSNDYYRPSQVMGDKFGLS